MSISISTNVKQLSRWTSDFTKRQIPIAASMAVNDLAFRVMNAENKSIAAIFPKAGRWTKTATQVQQKARKASPTAVVSIRKGRDYLNPYEVGGLHKLLPSRVGGTLLNPKDISLNLAGQIRPGAIVKLLSRPDVFVGSITFKKSGQTVRGIWQRPVRGKRRDGTYGTKGKLTNELGQLAGVKLLLRFGDAVPVREHLNFRKRAATVVRANADDALRIAMGKALATAR